MHSSPDIEIAKAVNGTRCAKCGAGYGFSACRQNGCPFGAASDRETPTVAPGARGGPKVIVLGNEKGGSGKSTVAMHLIVALMRRGLHVGSIDLDSRQGTLSRYVENRQTFATGKKIALDCPEHRRIEASDADTRAEAERDEIARLQGAMAQLADRDYVVIDTPGSASFLSRAGHGMAHTLITPINDSFLDLDLVARMTEDGKRVRAPGQYSDLVTDLRREQFDNGRRPMDWIVIRNRLSHIDARNKREIGDLLDKASERARFRVAPGLGQRVIFRELFLKGLTLLDLREQIPEVTLSMSHIAARQEVRSLLDAIGFSLDADPELQTESGSCPPPSRAGDRTRAPRPLASVWRFMSGRAEKHSS